MTILVLYKLSFCLKYTNKVARLSGGLNGGNLCIQIYVIWALTNLKEENGPLYDVWHVLSGCVCSAVSNVCPQDDWAREFLM